MTYFKDALERDASRYNSLLPMGVISLIKEDTGQAAEYFKRAYKLSPNSAALWNDLGMYMYQKKKIISAYSCLKRAIFLDPFRWDIHANMAIVLMNNKKYLAAHIHLRSALNIQK
jgi:Bardet-Biedl syndrome 4 protein